MTFIDEANNIKDQLIAWRRDIHQHPELSFQETRTARLVADNLREMGIEAEVGVGRTGVVGRIGEGKPVIGIRADMDALPIQEATNAPYASQTDGVMHACGHDAHTAILLGVARLLNNMPNRPQGEIRLLFQPSEEKADDNGISGATAMIADNALADMDSVIALHVDSLTPIGNIEIREGLTHAAVDTFEINILGVGCHGASPHNGIDPIYLQAQVVNAIQGIRSRRLKPTEASVITIGSIQGGTTTNVIPEKVVLKGTIRSYKEETRQFLHDELDKACQIVKPLGGDYTLSINRGYPPLHNDPEVAQLMRDVSRTIVGDDNTHEQEPGMGGEDFAYMTQLAPGAMLILGAQIGDDRRPHHNPRFDIDENCLPIGVAVLAESAIRLLNNHA